MNGILIWKGRGEVVSTALWGWIYPVRLGDLLRFQDSVVNLVLAIVAGGHMVWKLGGIDDVRCCASYNN